MTYYPTITSTRISKGYGYNVGGISNVTEKYDDVANTWTVKLSKVAPNSRSAGFSLNSYGYSVGGTTDTNEVEKYDNVLNTWTVKTDLNTGRSKIVGFQLNGYGYAVGGSFEQTTEKYDDVLNTWTAKSLINTGTDGSAGFSLNSYGYYTGGFDNVTTTQTYDDISDTWTTKATLNTGREYLSGFMLNSYGYVAGGYATDYSNVTEKYDDISNTWTNKATLNTAREFITGFSFNGYGYTASGYNGNYKTTTEKYDDVLNTWTAKTGLGTVMASSCGFSLGNLPQSIQNPDIQEIIEANRRLRANESMVTKVASANARNSHNAEITTTSSTYTKKKTIKFNQGLRGGYRVLFDLKTSDITKTAYGRLYRNEVALGTEQSEAGLVYATKSEDLTTSLSPGDTLELWMHNDGVGTTSAQNFQIAYDDSATIAVWSTNS